MFGSAPRSSTARMIDAGGAHDLESALPEDPDRADVCVSASAAATERKRSTKPLIHDATRTRPGT